MSSQTHDLPNLHRSELAAFLTSRNAMLLAALVVIGLVFQVLTRDLENSFLSARSISIVFTQASVIGVLACGMTFIIILTHIDLSVGSAIAFLGALAAWMMGTPASALPEALVGSVPSGLGWHAGVTFLIIMLIGVFIWAAMGLLQVRTGMPAFIITLGGMMGFRGLALLIAKRERVLPTDNLIGTLGTGYVPIILGWGILAVVVAYSIWAVIAARQSRSAIWYMAWVPCGLIGTTVLFLQLEHDGVLPSSRGIAYVTATWAVVAIVMTYLSQSTVYGRHMYAAGGNSEAAKLCGIRVNRVNVIGFILMGAITALASLIYLGQQGTAESAAGQLTELDAIAACVIGGVSLQGGRGTISGAVLGALIMQALTSGLYQCNVESGYQYGIKAVVLVAVVALDHLFRQD